jgi:methyl-accepting chemotaxis protein
VVQMDDATQQNAALVEEAAAAARALQEQAAGLTEVVGVFKLDGSQRQIAAPRPALAAATAKVVRLPARAAQPTRLELRRAGSSVAVATPITASHENGEDWETF